MWKVFDLEPEGRVGTEVSGRSGGPDDGVEFCRPLLGGLGL